MRLRAFSRHAVEKALDQRDRYRRIRILSNRLKMILNRPEAQSINYKFQTALGEKYIIIKLGNEIEHDDTQINFYYHDANTKNILFRFRINREKYSFQGKYQNPKICSMSESEAWLAIYELEEISYKLLAEKLKGDYNARE